MASTAVHRGPAPRHAVRDAADWTRVVVATLARGVVATLLGMALWAAAPAAIGWHPTTVMTGSMEPRLRPGDVVVSRPVPVSDLGTGQVLLADDPDQAGHLRMHRAVAVGPSGTIVTKGDANPQQDSTPVDRSAVHGVAVLRIPVVATPIVWLSEGSWTALALVVVGFAGLLWLCTIDGALLRTGSSGPDNGSGTDDGPGSSLEAPPTPATSAPSDHRSGRHVLTRGAAATVVLVVAGGIGVLAPAQATAAPWSRTTATQTGTVRAAVPAAPTGLQCAASGANAVTISWTHGSPDLPFGHAVLADGTQVTTAGPTATSAVLTATGLLDLGTTYRVTVRADYGSAGWNAATTSTSFVNVRVVNILGIISVTCA